MLKIKVLLAAILGVMVMGLGWWISSENSQMVSPTLVGVQLPSWNLGVWLFIMLLVGGIVGYLLSLPGYIRIRGHVLAVQRKLNRCEQEVAKLRTAGLRDKKL
jgi:uncharacterized membrane protein YciS (DUF1049 family)